MYNVSGNKNSTVQATLSNGVAPDGRERPVVAAEEHYYKKKFSFLNSADQPHKTADGTRADTASTDCGGEQE